MLRKIIIVSLGAFALFFIWFMYSIATMFTSFEHRENHNGVGWGQFSKSLKKHISQTDFYATDFSSYGGSVWFGRLFADDKSIKFGSFARNMYDDARNMNTLNYARIRDIGGEIDFLHR